MYNFYNLNPAHHTTSSNGSTSITLDVNAPLTNELFYKLFEAYYYDNTSEEKQDVLADHINHTDYLLAFISEDPNMQHGHPTSIQIHSQEDLNLLISTTDEREVYLPVFTDSKELKRFTTEPVFTLTVPAKWLWQFTLSQKNFTGIVFNPGSIGWDISLEHIRSLLDDLS